MTDDIPDQGVDRMDIAAVLALYMTSPYDYAGDETGDAFRALVAANPALEGLDHAELETVLWLRHVSLRLSQLMLRASARTWSRG